ncbi:MAG: HD domain-containing protein [Candidatus Aenigmatarchaeota archaeon]
MNRDESLSLLKKHVGKVNLLKHMYAVEAIMLETADFLNEDKQRWAFIGLIHDIDFEKTENNPESHTLLAEEMLSGHVDNEVIKIIKTHNFEHTKIMPQEKIEKALIAADAISGLVIASALIIPSKKLADVKVESIGKKFKQKDFARNCSRESILFCEQIGIPKEKFFELSLRALQKVSDELGL